MHYAILVYETEAGMREWKENPASRAAFGAYVKALSDAGVRIAGAGLEPPALATSLRIRNGQRMIQDGPYAETKEQLGGFVIVDVPDLDKALEWAARCPTASTGTVEVRPVMPGG